MCILCLEAFSFLRAGSGYLVAVFAKLVLPGGTVIGLEKVPELVRGRCMG